jgi:riboflavin synthase
MFTGLVAAIGQLVEISTLHPDSTLTEGAQRSIAKRLTLAAPELMASDPIVLGESIAVDGVCLTVVLQDVGRLTFDAGPETLERTTLGGLRVGDRVNLERALQLGERLGGHLVTGHVDGVGLLVESRERGPAWDVTIDTGPSVGRYLLSKGSITVDGISLTVNRVTDGPQGVVAAGRTRFEVSLIPHTQTHTTLASKTVGSAVNLEADLVGKYIERLVATRGTGSPK